MSSENAPDELPRVVLVAPRASDDDFLTLLDSPEVAGEWDTFDDPAEEFLNFRSYAGGKRIVEWADATRVGSVSWIQIPYGPNVRSLAWSIGITIHPDFRGRHLGAAAQRQLAEMLFDHSDANRVQADTDVGNVAEQRSLERAGFTREGVARQAQWRRGRWHDRVVYSILREEALGSRLPGHATRA
jgi:aminoglycoside 6'-N-acetyltransferase